MRDASAANAVGPAVAWRAVPGSLSAPPPARDRAGPAGGERLLSETDVGARFIGRLDAARSQPSRDALAAVRASVTELVDRLRVRDMPVERVLAAVETLLREHGVAPAALHAGLPDDDPAARADAVLRERVLDWCVRAYQDDAWW